MATIEQQLELEQRMIDSGASAYIAAQRRAEEDGNGHQLDYAHALTKEFVQPLTVALEAWLNVTGPGIRARARQVLKKVSPEKAVFIALRNLFSSFTREQPPVEIANNIGRMIEDEIRFSLFEIEHGAYYDSIIQDFRKKGTENYRHMHRVLAHKAKEKGMEWVAWTPSERVDVGTKLLNLILENTDLAVRDDRVHKNKNITMLYPTEQSLKWINEHEAVRQFMYPDRMPCLIEPDEWTSVYQGGYYSPLLRQNVPMIKQRKRGDKVPDLTRVMASINAVQRVPWHVNTQVLDILKIVWKNNLQIGLPPSEKLMPPPCPVDGIPKDQMTEAQQAVFTEWKHEASAIYTADKERISKTFQVTRIIRMAQEYSQHDNFYFVWYADFRGRLYSATAGFSPQGPDVAKGLLRFSRGKALGSAGWYWLRVHLANRFGYDKVSYDARVEWVDNQRASFLACADDPLSHRSIWANADKPYQFLAAIFEYAEAVRSTAPHDYVSYLPIGLDGSCNGLQNFSAMLRDEVGGAATNLVPGDIPSDIYRRVGDVTIRKVKERLTGPQKRIDSNGEEVDDWYFAQKWLAYGITRSDAKRPVMTLPYGATRQSFTQYIFMELIKKNRELFGQGLNFKAAVWLTPLLWSAIGEVVVAAREAMDWLQKSASVMTKIDRGIEWTTADGFVAFQKIMTIETVKIETQLAGRFQCRVGDYTNDIDGNRQRLGIAPNFVHSMDATHMRMTINNLVKEGIQDFAFIHDDYGTHACDTELLHRVIRETFVELYGRNDPLLAFKEEQEQSGAVLPELPAKGSLDLNAVLASKYFFG